MTPCREWRGETSWNGYGRRRIYDGVPTLNKDGSPRKGGYKGKLIRRVAVHRWVWEQINGPVPNGMHVMHLCDNVLCYRYDHLALGTAAENIADKVAKGRQARGVTNANARLNEDEVLAIFASTKTGAELAADFGVSQATISAIRTGRNWSHLTQGESNVRV